jgi:hypothetical protein
MHARTRVQNNILNQLRHRYWRRISIARSFAGKFFLSSLVPMMLLIRPWITMNKSRVAPMHIAFFIYA